ncbi:Uncharacterized protein dnm_068650 [Desulfonema magnum]|uniref:Secreted protein n=1 Tax=Desulfonema magnum TaxID=45655 RepID=A0A975BT80_9BACT|nr:Uncharacterized protein dnm_068650 [Desulfonema magnum]
MAVCCPFFFMCLCISNFTPASVKYYNNITKENTKTSEPAHISRSKISEKFRAVPSTALRRSCEITDRLKAELQTFFDLLNIFLFKIWSSEPTGHWLIYFQFFKLMIFIDKIKFKMRLIQLSCLK